MKLSVSMPEQDVALLDAYVREAGLRSRSEGVQRAVRRLRHERLEEDYAAAWAEWDDSGERRAWEAVAGDGLR